jgi:hypothetical protein
MPQDYVPSSDGEFLAWEQSFIAYASANLVALGLVAGDLTPVTTGHSAWETAWQDVQSRTAALAQAVQLKDDTRATFESAIRALVNKLQSSAAVSNDERAALGITVRDKTRTAVPVPTTRPVAVVNTSQRLRHEIAFADEGTPTKKARPRGVMGAEIWRAVTAAGAAAPAHPSGYTFIALDTSTPYVLDFAGADAGKTAHYILRWVNTRGQKGPWSETVSATIGGKEIADWRLGSGGSARGRWPLTAGRRPDEAQIRPAGGRGRA